MRKEQIIYLERPGPQNTEDVIDAVTAYIARSGLERVVVASTTGSTAVKFAAALEKKKQNWSLSHTIRASVKRALSVLTRKNGKMLERQGVTVLTQSHVLSGIERSISRKFGGISRVETIAEALRSLLGHGLKVCVEIANHGS